MQDLFERIPDQYHKTFDPQHVVDINGILDLILWNGPTTHPFRCIKYSYQGVELYYYNGGRERHGTIQTFEDHEVVVDGKLLYHNK